MEPNLAVNLDPDNITLGDIEDMETHFGIKLGDFQKVFRPGAQVDTDSLGIKMLCAIVFLVKRVEDPDFDPRLNAFYYARVLENPTCRWSTWDAIRLGIEPNPVRLARGRSAPRASCPWHSP